MFNYKFYLNKQKEDKNGLIPIMLLITYNSQRLRKSISGVKANLTHWDEKKQRINKQAKNETDNLSDIYNAELNEIENHLIQLKKEIAVNMVTFSEDLLMSRIFKNQPSKYNIFFYDKFDEYIELNKTSKAIQTVKSIVTSFNKIRDFETEKEYKIGYESINLDFFEKFRAYMLDHKKYGFNYFSKITATLKAFMNWSIERGFTNNNSYKRFKAPEKEIDIIALDEEELLQLLHYEYKKEKLNKIRDVFCFSCFTGLRFSDLISLKSEHIQNGYIIKNIIKTKERISIPITEPAQLILDKYKELINGPLPVISAQKYNTYIKECCKEAKLDKPTTITKNIGHSSITSTHPKYELITSHVGRKTFTTLSLVLGMSETSVKQITGHKQDANFRKYVKFTDKRKKMDMETAWDKLEKI
jgi:integrase